jgi:hypothetical protein
MRFSNYRRGKCAWCGRLASGGKGSLYCSPKCIANARRILGPCRREAKGHEERIRYYCDRASLGLPLFTDLPFPTADEHARFPDTETD